MKTALAVLLASILWTAVVITLMSLAAGQWPAFRLGDAWALLPGSIATSVIVRWLFRRRLRAPQVYRDGSLPFATIAVAGPVWTVCSYGLHWAAAGFQLQGYPFDGFALMLTMSVLVGLSAGLLLTYPAAYLTQSLFGLASKR